MMLPVFGGPEEGVVTWVDESELEARRLNHRLDRPGEPRSDEQRGHRTPEELLLAVRAMMVPLRPP